MLKNKKGITLVALVVTIVVLLILAGVSINLVLGNNGIIAKAKDAETKSAEASQNDLKGMNGLVSETEGALAGNGGAGGSGTGTKVPAEATVETAPYFPDNTFTKKVSFKVKGANVLIYDTKSQRVAKGSYADIQEGDEVFLYVMWQSLRSILVFR